MALDKPEQRCHLRRTVTALCRAIVGGRDYAGKVVDASLSGMAVDFDDELEAPPAPGTIIELDIERIGRVQAKVVRPRIDGVAVEHDPWNADLVSLLFDD